MPERSPLVAGELAQIMRWDTGAADWQVGENLALVIEPRGDTCAVLLLGETIVLPTVLLRRVT